MGLRKRMEEIGAHLQRFAAEEELLTAAGLGDWERFFALLDTLDRPVERGAAGECLEWALQNAPPRVFDRLLDRLPKGEYAGKTVVKGVPRRRQAVYTEVQGTLTLLAAACGKTEHLQCLLAHGWDVNSASPDAARGLRERFSGPAAFQGSLAWPAEPYSVRRESMLRILAEGEEWMPMQYCWDTFRGVTPLAAAVVCGRTGCARVLLAHGAWRGEAPTVAQALMMRDRKEEKRYQACRRAVLAEGTPMALWAVIRSCTPGQLEEELHRCAYGDTEIIKAVESLTENAGVFPGQGLWWEDPEEGAARLRVLARYAPQVLRQERQMGLLLRWGMEHEELRDFLLRLCPERVDLSVLGERLMVPPFRKMNDFLRRVCQGRTCVMDRDSVPPTTPPLLLRTLLGSVTFLPPSGRGVSGLSRALLGSGNLRLIRKALETGAIPPEESTKELLRCQAEDGLPGAVRALLLTVRRPGAAGGGAVSQSGPPGPTRFGWLPGEAGARTPRLGKDCSEAEALELISRGGCGVWQRLTWETADGAWHMHSPLVLLCLAGWCRALEAWVRCKTDVALREVHTLWPEGKEYELMGTALCIAAFAGQRQTVETLLELGAEAEEQHMGLPGLLRVSDEELPVTPLMAALVRERWEIAWLLLDHGAVCDLEQSAVKALWRVFRQEDLTETVERQLHGYLFRSGGRVTLTAKRTRPYNGGIRKPVAGGMTQ